MATPVEIVTYDPDWPMLFSLAARRFAALVGDIAVSIDHIGSTAVPGLAAKSLIDIDITIVSSLEMSRASELLVAAGYEPRGARYGDGVCAFLLRGKPGIRAYLCPPASETHRKRMAFRDSLRNDPTIASAYQRLKYELASDFRLDGDGYTAAKTGFIRDVLETDRN